MSQKCGAIWKEMGALQYWECVGDDVKPGKVTSFPQSVILKDDEVVVFAWIVYRSRAERDDINAKVMADPRLADMMDPKALPLTASACSSAASRASSSSDRRPHPGAPPARP